MGNTLKQQASFIQSKLPLSPPPPPRNLEGGVLSILSSSLVANFQHLWVLRSHQKQPQRNLQNFLGSITPRHPRGRGSTHIIFPIPTEKICMKPQDTVSFSGQDKPCTGLGMRQGCAVTASCSYSSLPCPQISGRADRTALHCRHRTEQRHGMGTAPSEEGLEWNSGSNGMT